ncbi:restriction endonuclease subunit S [Candidatus Dojkabacteria bacterium CG_4_9_14_3_um_filter_150_Dojkabacteria_WS6_41_13]|nr:MAG: restriction endonuclease subunit S [Candidatus Dojkabacteria bacterium CG_4_9_14_3_um_filter_150_Dojkabacteria_WS6_41_13]
MESNWMKVKLGDIVRINRGSSPRPIQDYISTQGIPWVKIADATASNTRYITSTKECIKESGRSTTVYPGDLIVSNSATPGIPKIMAIEACVHDGWLTINDYSGVDKLFLFYFFLDFRSRLEKKATGTVFNNLKTDTVKNLELYLPPLPIQQSIALILSSLDDKIELLREQNKTLEDLAQAMFKRWFVDFEFPNENGQPFKSKGGKMVESELGLIPEGWRVGRLTEIADFLNGVASQKYPPVPEVETLPVVKIRELSAGISEQTDKASTMIDSKYIVDSGDILFSWSGSLDVVIWMYGKGILNQHLFKVSSNEFPKWFYFYWVKEHLDDFRQIATSKAVTMGHIQRHHLDDALVVVPDAINLGRFDSVLSCNLNKQILNNSILLGTMRLRDTLLPELMKGAYEPS